jgi:hypothetical protein
MKILGKLNINPSRIIKNDELKAIKGGEPTILCNGYGPACVLYPAWCGNTQEDLNACNVACPGTTIAICFAW